MKHLTDEQQEAIIACEKLNEKLFTKYELISKEEERPILSVNIYDYGCIVNISIPHDFGLINIELFNSENNDREFIEPINDYEPLYSYLIKKFNELKKIINNIKL